MLENLVFSVNAVLPIFLVMVIGMVLKKLKIVDYNGAKQMNAVLFNCALPVKLFMDVSSSNFAELMDIKLILYAVGTTLAWFFICWGASFIFAPERQMKGAFIQASYRSNYAILGLPLLNSIMGGNVSKAAIITTFVVPLYNILSVLILTIYSGEKISPKQTLVKAARNVAKNPLIIGILIGIAFSIIKIPIPKAINKTLGYMADLSTPLALVSIGASMDFSKVKAKLKPAMVVAFLKLVAMPLIFIPIAFLINMPPENIVILFVMYAAPTAISSYVMAVNMGSDEYLASNAILLTSLLSIITYTIGVYILRVMGIV
ncbi:AEC family transporter [Tyzzerella sp. OttesenSCG-928-J15]|nr:AEC family transporter [Tyzzerella sp. OttesenSCG-928-J15]